MKIANKRVKYENISRSNAKYAIETFFLLTCFSYLSAKLVQSQKLGFTSEVFFWTKHHVIQGIKKRNDNV